MDPTDPVLETVEPLVSLFDKFFTDHIMKFICEESIRYAISNGNHSFTIDTNALKAFIAIPMVSGYVDLPRRPMYWKQNEIQQYYHYYHGTDLMK